MAKLDPRKGLIGNIGDLVFRNVNGETIVQTRPERNKKFPLGRSKQTATDFGRASKTTSLLISGLRPFVMKMYDTQFFNRFRKAVYQGMRMNTELQQGSLDFWQGETWMLEGLEVNLKTPFSEYVRIPGLHISFEAGSVEIFVPQFEAGNHLHWPQQVAEAEVCFFVSAYSARDYQLLKQELFSIPIKHKAYSVASASYASATIPPESLILITAGILFYAGTPGGGRSCLNSKTFNPAKLLKVFKYEVD